MTTTADHLGMPPLDFDLDDVVFVQAPPPGEGPYQIQQRFEAFHAANPWVYRALVKLARDLAANGRTKIGMGMLFEVLRWQWLRATTGDEFKLNNNYRSRYSRLIMATEADLDGVFDTRELTA